MYFRCSALDNLVRRIAFIQNFFNKNNQKLISNELDNGFNYLVDFSTDVLKELHFFDIKIAFVTSAQMLSIQV